MTLPTVSIRQVSHNQLYRCIRVLYDVHHEVCTTPSHQARQAAEFRRMKDGLDGADVLLHFDFSDNFSCSHQESIQSVYWCQSQVSIFTVAVYRKDADPEHLFPLISQITQRPPLSSIWSIFAVHGSNTLL